LVPYRHEIIGSINLKDMLSLNILTCGGLMSTQFNIQKISERENRVIGRKEVFLKILHEGKGTPSYEDVRKVFSNMYNVSNECFVIKNISTKYGEWTSIVTIYLYKDPKRLLEIEPEHVLRKNGFISKVKESEST